MAFYFNSRFLTQFEVNGHIVQNADVFTILLTRMPLWHRFYNPFCFFVATSSDTAKYLHVGNVAFGINYK